MKLNENFFRHLERAEAIIAEGKYPNAIRQLVANKDSAPWWDGFVTQGTRHFYTTPRCCGIYELTQSGFHPNFIPSVELRALPEWPAVYWAYVLGQTRTSNQGTIFYVGKNYLTDILVSFGFEIVAQIPNPTHGFRHVPMLCGYTLRTTLFEEAQEQNRANYHDVQVLTA